MKSIFAGVLICLFIQSCTTKNYAGILWKEHRGVDIQTDTKPGIGFSNKRINNVTVLPFDAKSVKTLKGQIIDYVELGNDFTDDLVQLFYKQNRIKVTVGEFIEEIEIHDSLEKKTGDLNVRSTEVSRVTKYKAAPYKKVDAIISGRITAFRLNDSLETSFVEIYFKMTDSYNGNVFWISRMRGLYGNVLETLVSSVNSARYIESKKYKSNNSKEEK